MCMCMGRCCFYNQLLCQDALSYDTLRAMEVAPRDRAYDCFLATSRCDRNLETDRGRMERAPRCTRDRQAAAAFERSVWQRVAAPVLAREAAATSAAAAQVPRGAAPKQEARRAQAQSRPRTAEPTHATSQTQDVPMSGEVAAERPPPAEGTPRMGTPSEGTPGRQRRQRRLIFRKALAFMFTPSQLRCMSFTDWLGWFYRVSWQSQHQDRSNVRASLRPWQMAALKNTKAERRPIPAGVDLIVKFLKHKFTEHPGVWSCRRNALLEGAGGALVPVDPQRRKQSGKS